MFIIAYILINVISLVGALLYLSIAWGILVAKGWARILGISVSILVLPYLILGMISGVMTVLHMYPYIDLPSSLMFLMRDGILTTLNIASIYFLIRPEVKAYFKKKRISEREEELSKKEYEKLTEEEKHMKEEYEQLMEED
ncbi:hypothetical protein KAW11_04335 [Candidatus Bathyarchaeota archaeon]|nr:hypothetical protein [Candidatus Bathyarchaeota archaeon]